MPVLLALAGALCACAPAAPAADAAPAVAGDTIALVSARAFDGSDRVARLLDAMASASDVLGPTRFVTVEPPDGALESLPALLEDLRGARAVMVILGDLSVLDGLDPTIPDRGPDRLISRRIPPERVEGVVHALRRSLGPASGRMALATAPLGKQGRIEVPELLAVAQALRDAHPVVDLGARFGELEPAPLFTNGIDRLDAYGHDELARALYEAFCAEDGPVPPRDEAERAARAEARALRAFAAGDSATFGVEAPRALEGRPASARHAMRRAALAAAWRGPDAGVAQLSGADPAGRPVPGLALWRALRGEPYEGPSPEDPFEAALVEVLRAIVVQDPSAVAKADALVGEAPHRLESWIVDHLARVESPAVSGRLGEVRRHLAHFPRTAVADRVTAKLLDAWPATLTSLPAVYLASRPHDVLQPTGPILEAARRRALLGHTNEAWHLMRQEMGTDRFPAAWLEARDDWSPH